MPNTIREEFQMQFPTGAFTDMQRAYMREIFNFFSTRHNEVIGRLKMESREINGTVNSKVYYIKNIGFNSAADIINGKLEEEKWN